MIWLPQRYARRQRNTSQSNISCMSLMSFVLQAELARGDVSKSIQCYMHERNVSEDVAREKLREMIRVNWRALNGDRTSSSPPEEYFKRVAINIPRMAQFLYEYGDGYGLSELQVEEPTWIPSDLEYSFAGALFVVQPPTDDPPAVATIPANSMY
ncbi:hypothetical protein GW17_00056305 [Ensete ventricosum]|nr:hypothetical protein GW17_00056305 [Ensete ventricosum]